MAIKLKNNKTIIDKSNTEKDTNTTYGIINYISEINRREKRLTFKFQVWNKKQDRNNGFEPYLHELYVVDGIDFDTYIDVNDNLFKQCYIYLLSVLTNWESSVE
jgi:hypothetical protein